MCSGGKLFGVTDGYTGRLCRYNCWGGSNLRTACMLIHVVAWCKSNYSRPAGQQLVVQSEQMSHDNALDAVSPYSSRNSGKYELQCTSNAYNLQRTRNRHERGGSTCMPRCQGL